MIFVWLILGALLGTGALLLYQSKKDELVVIDWLLVALFAIGLVFTVATVSSFAVEPYQNSGRAALISLFIFGGVTLLIGVGAFRKIFAG